MGTNRGLTTKTLLVRKDFLEAQAKAQGEGEMLRVATVGAKVWTASTSPYHELKKEKEET